RQRFEGTFHMTRRDLLSCAGVLAPIKALGAEVKPVRIKNVETFNIEIPATPTEVEAGVNNRTAVVRVETESGVRGYSFGPAGGGGGGRGAAAAGFPLIRTALVGADLFAMEQHLKRGLINWGGIEEALWDAIGIVANQPVYRLLGGSITSIPVYITA